VRAQVDHDLTTVDYFDRLLGLIKNLGRHSCVTRWRCSFRAPGVSSDFFGADSAYLSMG
jgi:hypothetical protein